MPKNTSNARFGQVLSEIWPPEVFGSQNSCGRAQMGPVHTQTGPVRVQTQAGRAQTGPKSQKTLEGHISLTTCPQKLLEAISHSKLVRIGRLRYFLASTFPVNAKKHLKRPIWTSFE